MSTKSMSCISALYDGTKLGIADTCLLTGGTHGAWTNPHLDNAGLIRYGVIFCSSEVLRWKTVAKVTEW
ncbi:hypothetical protein MAR_026290 [Mya arenaria]|uniref:Uncharacterized protein n=1 Tax=Mya arenaria TaxID=6604 RepID=A0ABY7EQ47_MYAAR|nr:hypothetical protein MAR_026290 [Mya arenaria]